MSDLLPCPFCGSAAAKQSGVVWCSNCGIGTSPDCLTTEEAMSDWNTRANKPAALDEKIKRYEEALRFYADLSQYEGISLGVAPLNDDRGNRARKALDGTE